MPLTDEMLDEIMRTVASVAEATTPLRRDQPVDAAILTAVSLARCEVPALVAEVRRLRAQLKRQRTTRPR